MLIKTITSKELKCFVYDVHVCKYEYVCVWDTG